jgi:hypothetical protein
MKPHPDFRPPASGRASLQKDPRDSAMIFFCYVLLAFMHYSSSPRSPARALRQMRKHQSMKKAARIQEIAGSLLRGSSLVNLIM